MARKKAHLKPPLQSPLFKPAAKQCSDLGEMAGVSGGIGAANACTRMYRLDFIAQHGMHSDKAISGPDRRERFWADPDLDIVLTEQGLVGAALLVTFLAYKSDSRTDS